MRNAVQAYSLYGLRVHSELVLPAPIAQNAVPPYDITVNWGESKASSERIPAGKALARLSLGDGRGYVLVQTDDGYTFRFHKTCEFWIAPDLRSVRVHLFADVQPAMAAALFVGNVMACILAITGEDVLHASAVEVGDSALAFVGASGMGKSTLAALFCASGARLITDDLLRLQPNANGFRCFPGTAQIRLRQSALGLAECAPAVVQQTTLDQPALTLDEPRSLGHLRAIVIPCPSRGCQRLRLHPLTRSMALIRLMRYARVQGLREKEHLQRRFRTFANIVRGVPVFEAEVPWGPPFSTEIAAGLARRVGLDWPEEARH
jgi:hypothetical protein